MDWMLKASIWEFSELGRDDFPVLTESSSTSEGNKNVEFFHVDRVLDGLGKEMVKKTSHEKELVASTEALALRRARGYSFHNQQTLCLVDGCTSDLSSCRDYHRRHRVCERHSKTPIVLIGGNEQRFCQQCSRFHSLGEFDDIKRSCRKRLDGHNRRRRKPQPESLYLSCGNFSANHQGEKLLDFGSREVETNAYSSSSGSITWASDNKCNNQSTSANSTSHVDSKTGINFPFLLEQDQLVPEILNKQTSRRTPGILTRLVKSKSALSLLSSNNSATQTQTSRIPPSHLLIQQDIQHGLNGIFHFRSEGFMENEGSQLISFSCE